MRALELLNKLTLGNKLFVVISLTIGLSTTVNAEIADANRPLTDKQHNDLRCDSTTANWRTEQKAFKDACSRAGLGGVESCKKKLDNCTKSSTRSYCLSDATSLADHRENMKEARDEKRELQERKDSLMQEFRDKQSEILEAKEAQDLIQQEIQNTLADNENQKVQRQLELEQELQKIVNTVASTRDQIALAELELNGTILEGKTECRKEAQAEKERYIALVRGRKLTVNQMFGRTNLSINQAGSIRYELVLRNCTSIYNSRGGKTAFGDAYLQQKKNITLQQNTLKRQILNLNRSKETVVRNTQQALAALDQKSQGDLVRFQNENTRATQRIQMLQQQGQQMLADYRKLDGEMNILGRQVSGDQVKAISTLAAAGLSSVNSVPGNDRNRTAKQSKIDAFNDAMGLLGAAENAQEDIPDTCDNAKNATSIAAAAAAVEENINISGTAADTTTAIATAIDDPSRTPAADNTAVDLSPTGPTAGETL